MDYAILGVTIYSEFIKEYKSVGELKSCSWIQNKIVSFDRVYTTFVIVYKYLSLIFQ